MPASTSMPPSKPAAEWTLWYAKQNRIFIKESNAKQENYSCSTRNQSLTLTIRWKIMQSFKAWNASSRISSQPESREMPWSHFVAWLYALSALHSLGWWFKGLTTCKRHLGSFFTFAMIETVGTESCATNYSFRSTALHDQAWGTIVVHL